MVPYKCWAVFDYFRIILAVIQNNLMFLVIIFLLIIHIIRKLNKVWLFHDFEQLGDRYVNMLLYYLLFFFSKWTYYKC